jgi:hypothetical protein
MAVLLVEQDVADQEGVLALDLLRPADVAIRATCSRGSARRPARDQDAAHRLDLVAQLALVPDPHGESLPAFDGGGQFARPPMATSTTSWKSRIVTP